MPLAQCEYEPGSLLTHFGTELRHHRTKAQLSLQRLAEKLGYTAQWINQVELAKKPPSEKFAMDVDTFFGTDGRFHRIWNDHKKEKRRRVLLPGFPAYLEAEAQATSIRSFSAQLVPGLLQSENYARAISSAGRTPAALEDWVAARMEEQAILRREKPPKALFILDESTLHRPVGGPEVMSEQLDMLARFVDAQHIQVRILSFASVTYAGLDGSFTVLHLKDGGELLYQEGPGFGQLIDDAGLVDDSGVRFDLLMGEALPANESREMILRALEDFR
ncbi:helix-turn-helix transcriptional regulator [Spirillospora sp. NPDC029432]|uniref:helix-turn-helix domain-containing protein n=1 Tax=Spirillospora sp. NPDC029432 TaxID=3154599 RepID=UPI0034565C04